MKSKTSLKVLLFLLLVVNAGVVHAQGSPCEPGFQDGDSNCPLDTWVIVLVVAASAFAFVRLYRRNQTT